MLAANTTAARSPRTDSNRRPRPYQRTRSNRWSYEGVTTVSVRLTAGLQQQLVADRAGIEPAITRVKASLPMPAEHRPSGASRQDCLPIKPRKAARPEPPAGSEPATFPVQAGCASSCAKEAGAEVPRGRGGHHPPMLCLWLAPHPQVLSRGSSLRRATGDQLATALPVSSVRFERTLPRYSGACLLPLGYEDERAPDPDRTGASPLRAARSCRLSYKGMATRVGIEPTCS